MLSSSILPTLLLGCLVVAGLTRAAEASSDCPDDATQPCRVGGDLDVRVEAKEGRDGSTTWRSGRCSVETALPEGYPRPTPPGAIEIKDYPLVRRAVTPMGEGRNGAFWPLFNHIKSRDIAMTSPVEMDYAGLRPGAGERYDSATMAFLYRRVDQGPVGLDGAVEVQDLPALRVLSLGVKGRHGVRTTEEKVEELADWLAENPEWEIAGDARALHYNGPMTWPGAKWSEVQLPIARRVN